LIGGASVWPSALATWIGCPPRRGVAWLKANQSLFRELLARSDRRLAYRGMCGNTDRPAACRYDCKASWNRLSARIGPLVHAPPSVGAGGLSLGENTPWPVR
jgi:hypothetical protein